MNASLFNSIFKAVPDSISQRHFFQMEDEVINWWPTPPETPELNPIECMWHEMKEYVY